METKKFRGDDDLKNALKKLNINLVELVAATALWATPEYCNQLKEMKGTTTRYPNIRRKKGGEKKGDIVELKIEGVEFIEIKADDNTYANNAIKDAIGNNRTDFIDYTTCHIYPRSCYDERYHTKIENLVLIPKAIAFLSDHFQEVEDALIYRSYELYGFCLDENNPPQKPANYPTNWLEPICTKPNINKNILKLEEDETKKETENIREESLSEYISTEDIEDLITNEIKKIKRRVPKWFDANKNQINSIILINFMELLEDKNCVQKDELVTLCLPKIEKFFGNFNQMTNFGERNHGKVFDVHNDVIYLWKPIRNFVISMLNIKNNTICKQQNPHSQFINTTLFYFSEQSRFFVKKKFTRT